MEQLQTLVWVKWRIFFSQLRSSRVLVGQLVLWIFGVLTLLLALGFGAGVFVWLYHLAGSGSLDIGAFALPFVLLLLLGSIYLVWAMGALLPSRTGGSFDPANLLHYPLPMHRLFLLDLASELFKGMSLLLLPSLIALHLALPFAAGRPLWALLPLVETLLLVVVVSRTLECLLTLLNRRGRSSGEGVMAIVGIVIIVGIMAIADAAPHFRHALLHSPAWWAMVLRKTPLLLTTDMLSSSLEGDFGRYLAAGTLQLGYILATFGLCYWLWRRLALGDLGGRKKGRRLEALRRPWRVPGLGELETALLEKELKYLVRNPQVRILMFMPLLFPILKLGLLVKPMAGSGSSPEGTLEQLPDLARVGQAGTLDGLALVFATAYLLLFYSVLFNNAFGLDGQGFKAYLLAPVARRTLLRVKNGALTLVMGSQGLVLLALNQVLFHDLGLQSLVVAALSFATGVAVMSGVGNLVSIHFPRQSEYGKKLEASRWAVVLTFLEVPVALAPVWLAFGLGFWLDSLEIKYTLLVGGTLGACVLYARILLPMAAARLRTRETLIVDTITGGDE